MEFIRKLFKTKTKELEEENENLRNALKECGEKLVEKQDHINKTNAYWKKRFHNFKKSKGL